MTLSDLLSHLSPTLALWAAAAGALIVAARKAWPWLSRVKDFIDDLMGEPERPGVPARPGVMARLAAHEGEMVTLRVEVTSVRALAESAEYHSKPNGGGSAYDLLMAEVRSLRGDFGTHLEQAARRDERLDRLETAVGNLAEALPVVARSVPHPIDAHLPIGDSTDD